jgi:excisionase family DNA binding protein
VATVERLLWTIDDVVQATGLSVRGVKRLVAENRLPGVVRVGRRRLFDRGALESWISLGCPEVHKAREARR